MADIEWAKRNAGRRKTTGCGCGSADREHRTSCMMHGSEFLCFKWLLPAVSSGMAVDSGPNIATTSKHTVVVAFSCVFLSDSGFRWYQCVDVAFHCWVQGSRKPWHCWHVFFRLIDLIDSSLTFLEFLFQCLCYLCTCFRAWCIFITSVMEERSHHLSGILGCLSVNSATYRLLGFLKHPVAYVSRGSRLDRCQAGSSNQETSILHWHFEILHLLLQFSFWFHE